MDDVCAINVAKTEFREAYNSADVERLVAILASDFIDYSDGRRSGYGEGAKKALRARFQEIFTMYDVRLVPIIIEVRVFGDVAVDYGWQEFTLTPKSGGEPMMTKTRYVEIWKKDGAGKWKLSMFIDNMDVPDQIDVAQAG
jgi:ketosteroid isomerase-like protein